MLLEITQPLRTTKSYAMENIYKIKIRTNPDTSSSYPSERRYSASTVLGLGVVHLFLATTAVLLATLSLLPPMKNHDISTENRTTLTEPTNMTNGPISQQNRDLEMLTSVESSSTELNNSALDKDSYNFSVSITIAPCLMSLGALCAGLSALLAWKRWYIDNNITWCLFMSLFSTLTSLISVILALTTVISIHEMHQKLKMDPYDFTSKTPNLRFVLTVNVLIASILELIWSLLSTRFAYVGMSNKYPEDIVISRHRGKMMVSTVQKGSKKLRITPPDILNHFPDAKKLAKYFPSVRDNNGSLPKCESSAEYQERVRRFLSSNSSNTNGQPEIEVQDAQKTM